MIIKEFIKRFKKKPLEKIETSMDKMDMLEEEEEVEEGLSWKQFLVDALAVIAVAGVYSNSKFYQLSCLGPLKLHFPLL